MKDYKVVESSWNKFPTENDPYAKYKFFSFHPILDPHLKKIFRKTDNILDWMGDCGGLYDGLNIFGRALINFYQVYFFNS